MSDHLSVEPIPAYKTLICRTNPTIKAVQVWTEEASLAPGMQPTVQVTGWPTAGPDRTERHSAGQTEIQTTEDPFTDNNPYEMWRGIGTITDYRSSN